MLSYKIMEKEAILLASPQSSISVEDFNNISKDVDAFLENNECLEGLIVYAKTFNGWENFSSLINHLKFVKEHHKSIKKIAFVTDDKVLSFLPNIAKHFVNAQIENFAYENKNQAIEWIVNPKQKEHGISIGINQSNDNFYIRLDIKGTLSVEDYDIMIPIIEDTIKNVPHPKIKILVNGLDFDGWELKAAWEDLKFGLKHNKEFKKVAYIGSRSWEEYGIKISNWFTSGQMQYFEDETSAKQWLKD